MRTMLNSMKKRNSGIPKDIIPIFEEIVDRQKTNKLPEEEYDELFYDAMDKNLNQEQKYWLFGQNGSCKGTSGDNERKAFAEEHSKLPLGERVKAHNRRYGSDLTLNADDTLTLFFVCGHGYYKKVKEKKLKTPPPRVQEYFERCAGGRMYGLEQALGVKLRIKSVDISPIYEDMKNPVRYTFELIS